LKISIILVLVTTAFSGMLIVDSLASFSALDSISVPLTSEIPQNIEELQKQMNLDSYANQIRYHDEILTQSARNYAFTQDAHWFERYEEHEPMLGDFINKAIIHRTIIIWYLSNANCSWFIP